MNYRLRRWLRFVAILIIVLILCWQNATSSKKLTNIATEIVFALADFFGGTIKTYNLYRIVRKAGHFLVFLVLGLFGHLAISGDADNVRSAIICSVTTGSLIAVVAEFFQAYALGRHATFRDAEINLGGIALGIIIGIIIEVLHKKRENELSKT